MTGVQTCALPIYDDTLRVWDLETGECVAIVRLNAPCYAAAATDGGLIVAGPSTGDALFFDLRGIDLGAAGGGSHA